MLLSEQKGKIFLIMSTIIRLEKVTKVYPMGDIDVAALRSINLEIKDREFVAIVGPSGSGKSTLMHLIGLLDRPTRGRVFLGGRDVSKISEEKRAELRNKHIGFVFQTFNLLPRASALDNVSMPLVYSGMKSQERAVRATEALRRVGLEHRLRHHPSQLSGGEQQRVAIARALVNNPSIILADEPTGNLDTRSGREILRLLKDLNKSGDTVVLVTHELALARSATRIIKIKDGEVQRDRKRK